MPFHIVRNDITKMNTDAIVNTANPLPVFGQGTDSAIYYAAGIDKMLAEREEIGLIEPGEAAFTSGFELPAKYVIHTVSTTWRGGDSGEEEILHKCYKNSLGLAEELECKSLAFPFLGTGSYGVPKELALKIAMEEITSYVLNGNSEMDIYLVVYDLDSFEISSKVYSGIDAFIDENYVVSNSSFEYLYYPLGIRSSIQKSVEKISSARMELKPEVREKVSKPEKNTNKSDEKASKSEKSIEDFLSGSDESFGNTLQRMIAEKNLANSVVYKRANMDRKLFSKIISNKNYVPKKSNVIALAIGLELKMEDAVEFLATAGYAFAKNDKSDLIVSYFISNNNFNIFEINEALFKYELPVLGMSDS